MTGNIHSIPIELDLVANHLPLAEYFNLRFAFVNSLAFPHYSKLKYNAEICNYFNCDLEYGPFDQHKQFFYSFKEFTDSMYLSGIIFAISKINEMIRIRPSMQNKKFDLVQLHSNFSRYICTVLFRSYSEQQRFFINCVESENEFLIDSILDSAIQCNQAFLASIIQNKIEIVKKLVQKREYPGFIYSEALKIAAGKGYLELVKLLVNSGDISSTFAICAAASNGQIKCLEFLLNDQRFAPSEEAFQESCTMGHLEATKLLGKYLDPSCKDNMGIRRASQNGHLDIVKFLMNDKRVDPSAKDNQAFRQCARRGYLDIIKLLLTDPKVDITANNHEGLIQACISGHFETVDFLFSALNVPIAKRFEMVLDLATLIEKELIIASFGGAVIGTVGAVKMAQNTSDKTEKRNLMNIHKSFALIVAVLVPGRIGARLLTKSPINLPGTKVEHFASHTSHLALYGLMVGLPASGITMGYFSGSGLPFFGWKIPGAAEPKKQVSGAAYKAHRLMGQIIVYLIPLHIGAAFYHTFRGHKIFARVNPFKGQ
ncbi:hypothetical protein HDV01_007526 [Terramyces sp. JEL0728]|nr:hypothetical protein HDV01_007526 [Terramyces sp. JEL0728]